MKKIKYEVCGSLCNTPCPYWNKIEGTEGYNVGSGACYCCPYCVSQDSDNKILECKADELFIEGEQLS